MGLNLSTILCDKCYQINDLSVRDIEQIKLLLLDFFAAAFAGYKQNDTFNKKVEKVILEQEGKKESSVLFLNQRLPARYAAFLNSLYGHGAELDDGNKKAMGHVGVHVIPAVLALAEAEHKTHGEIFLAIVAGYEAYIRISAAAQPGLVNRCFHSTGMAGAPACAIACAKLLGLSAEEMENAMSLACTMSSGLLTYSESQQMIKPINPAKAAETGVFAARLSQAGIKGPENSLEGPHGWFRAVSDSVDERMITDQYDHLLIHECYFKLYPSCRHTHCGIEAAVNLYDRVKDEINHIKSINVYIYPNAIKLAGQIKFPKDPDETKFSIHYTLACALLFGKYGVDHMNPPCNSAALYDLIEKIKLIPDEKMEMRDKGVRGTRVEVILQGEKKLEETVLVPKGDPEKPLSQKDIIDKLYVCADGLLSEKQIEQLIVYITKMDETAPFSPKKLFGRDNLP